MRTATWNGIGNSVADCRNIDQVLKASGLDYTVEKRPVFMNAGPADMTEAITAIPNRFVTVRTSDTTHMMWYRTSSRSFRTGTHSTL